MFCPKDEPISVQFIPQRENEVKEGAPLPCPERGHGNLPNQSTYVLWIWRRHLTVYLGVSGGGVLQEYGVLGPLLRAVQSLYKWSESFVFIAGCRSDLFSELDPVRAVLCH